MTNSPSRLDRLLTLLDSGSVSVRSAAATQIGEVTKYHQQELPAVLLKVGALLRSKSWETRTAAGQAIAAIAKNVAPYEPEKIIKIIKTEFKEEDIKQERAPQDEEEIDDFITFDTFDIISVQNYGQPLMAKSLIANVSIIR